MMSFLHHKQYRIIPSTYPPINFFEDIVDANEMDILFEIESLTNPRLRQAVGELSLVLPEDRVSGAGSSVVMAAFTHIHQASRFTDGSYGVYYAGLSLETSIRETIYHREKFMRATQENACEITMRVYEGKIAKELYDARAIADIHHKDNYFASQDYGKKLKQEKSWGIIYNSVRHQQGICIAAFRPPAVSIPIQTMHLRYCWNGERVTAVLNTQTMMVFESSM